VTLEHSFGLGSIKKTMGSYAAVIKKWKDNRRKKCGRLESGSRELVRKALLVAGVAEK